MQQPHRKCGAVRNSLAYRGESQAKKNGALKAPFYILYKQQRYEQSATSHRYWRGHATLCLA